MSARGILRTGLVAAAGAVGAFLLDPARGRARRARLRDRSRSFLRREVHAAGRQASLQRGRVVGLAHRMRHRQPSLPESDRVLLDKIRSEVLGRHPRIAHHINLDACDGRVTLRGEVDDLAEVDDVLAAMRRVPGVVEVTSLLHAPGQPAPNKADALRAHA